VTLLFKPIAILLGLVGGQVGKAIFTRVWSAIDDEDAPKPLQEEQTWARVLTVAVVQGAIFQVVKATIQRSGAKTVAYLTGVWPGPKRPEPK
jgi:xanthosine utilization system XapX-like protein